ncbi:MAG: PAS-domain containing protein [Rhodovarius sp.]|nr:PAS-domain containing protein [Rhodovarius sp.]
MNDRRRDSADIILDALPVGVLAFDAERQLLLANRWMLELAGVGAQHLPAGLPLADVIRLLALRGLFGVGDPEARVAEYLALEHGRPHARLLRREDGSTFEFRSEPLAGGGLLAVFTDVTPLAAPLEESKAEVSRLETVLEALGSGVALFDGDWRLRLHNLAFAHLLGLPANRLGPGVAAQDLIRLLAERAEMTAEAARSFAADLAGIRRDSATVIERRRANGTTLRSRFLPLPAIGATLVEVNDITALRAAEGEARRRAAMLDSILSALPVGVVVWGPDRRARFVNAAYNRIMSDSPVAEGDRLEDVIARRAAAGEYGPITPEQAVARMLERLHLPLDIERRRPDGRVISLKRQTLPDGGLVATVTELTALHAARAEAAAQAQMLRTMLDTMRHGIALFSPEGVVLAVNRLAAELTGLTPEQFRPGVRREELRALQIAAGEFGSPEETARFVAQLESESGSDAGRYIRRRPDGTAVEVVTVELPDGGFVRTYTDVTRLLEAEQQAAARAATLSVMLEGIRHGLAMFGPDRRLVAANRLAGEMIGVPDLPQRIGQRHEDILRLQFAAGNLGSGERGAALMEQFRSLDRSRPQRVTRRLEDGRVIETVSDPTPDGGFIVALSDITRLVEAEEEARRRSALFEVMLEHIRHGICLFDAEQRVLAANRRFAEMVDLTPAELRPGLSLAELVAMLHARGEFGDGPEAAEIAAQIAAWPRHLPNRRLRRRRNGRWLEVVSDPTPDGGFVITYTDVTEQQEAQAAEARARAAAEAASRAKSSFLATMSHELRTPLTAVIGFAEALERMPDAPRRREYLAAIREAGQHLLDLINDILDVARAEQGALVVRRERVNTAAVMEEALRLIAAQAEARGVQLALDLPPGLPDIEGDAIRLRQILLNLLSNAVKFTPAGGAVLLSATVLADGGVRLQVTDTGLGMAAEDIPRAFEPFQQLDTGHARRFEGSGIGLPLSRALAEAQGGSLTLESAPGRGTTATLAFPPNRVLLAERSMP